MSRSKRPSSSKSSSRRRRGKGKGKSSQHRQESILRQQSKKSVRPAAAGVRELSHADYEQTKKARQKTEDRLQHWQVRTEHIRHTPKPENPPMDPWQQEALESLLNGEHVVVDAPTTAGKTRVVEEFFKLNIQRSSFRASYTTPVKSLSNDKVREFSDMFGVDQVGIATGDIKENLDAPIVVATLESYRNSLLGVEPDLGRSLVIFDEYHFMQDSSRGSAWEEAIILTPPHCQLLLLSASVDNAEEFCSWIQSLTHRTCRLIRTEVRPVPLEALVYFREQWLLADEVKKLAPASQSKISRFPLEQKEVARRLRSVEAMQLTPCIVYSGQRLACETMAMELCKVLEPLPKSESLRIKTLLETECEVDEPTRFMKANLRKMLIMYGIGYHHSGIAPQGRRAVEILVKQGALRFCTATMGLSIGINFSVRATVISDYRRPGEGGFTQYSVSEVLQMLGRAGRRGRDAVGYSLWPSVQSFYKLGSTKREECQSRLKNDPTTFLGLIGRGYRLRDMESFYEKSFMGFAHRGLNFKLIRINPLRKHLKSDDLPCKSPAFAWAKYQKEELSDCTTCTFQNPCHHFLVTKHQSSLAALHVHLHQLNCLNDEETLTNLGRIARFFPQGGGLLVATMISEGNLSEERLLAAAELMAALSLARFKEPTCPEDYRFPFDKKMIERRLEAFYPIELFEELYDPPNSRRDYPVLRDFNPAAGYIVSEWLKGCSWQALRQKVCHEKFAEGDLVAIMYRTATYLQSLSQAKIPNLSSSALLVRNEILKEPLTPSLRREELEKNEKKTQPPPSPH
ncbi:DEAD/DEAH box helicase [Pseudobacteriovorax antillogorgiicola]|uniref:DSHCT (NUC185) domain-containing protein n=1 Tax=Pseudobacteriovorax antillogorgiicola TaxID=1513793 RepID=A0A1Y6BUE2_9BACT|nr:DEAD/DEAH box helicase [Pseudobacteriovorax antillogorgiicola]TCS53820.1 DSHCT (NUC185) domain-containing protein [Pseudobacteriovorax antillogorgiicola]SMF21888.1 DSHCT (NUC185) domain-containing protein [Pseudobacteriovorax antillogorgiicola]